MYSMTYNNIVDLFKYETWLIRWIAVLTQFEQPKILVALTNM